MLGEGALAISVPVSEWQSGRPPGSVFFRRDLIEPHFSSTLVRALDLVFSACAHAGFEPVFVARPEIFTHGESLAWLKRRLGFARDHLCFSDGVTIKLIPGMRNHVFFYGLSRRADSEALDRLHRRFPEMFGVLRNQFNSALRLGPESPAPIVIEGAPSSSQPPVFYPISLHRYSANEGLRRTMLGGPRPRLPHGLDALTYVPLTEASLADIGFMRSIAELYDGGYFSPARALVVRPPETFGASSDLEDRLEACLTAMGEGGARAPLAPASNAWFATDDVPATTLAEVARHTSLLTHDSYDFWRASPAEYRLFRSRKIFARRGRNLDGEFDHLIEALCGEGTEILWRDVVGDPK